MITIYKNTRTINVEGIGDNNWFNKICKELNIKILSIHDDQYYYFNTDYVLSIQDAARLENYMNENKHQFKAE